MPGGHLTYEDRRKIADGLAQGLPYAKIDRRLGRPRSTVGREIARNGGPRGYHAAWPSGCGMSPASISKGVGALEQLGLVKRERDNRRERYFIDDEVW